MKKKSVATISELSVDNVDAKEILDFAVIVYFCFLLQNLKSNKGWTDRELN